MKRAQEPDIDISPLGCLALLWPTVPDCLVSPAARQQLETAAARLAPIARIALELRLGKGGDEVDLHQFISRSSSDAAVLARYLSECGRPAPGEETVRRFLSAWADDAAGVRTDLDGFFLEWDGPTSHSDRAPAIFLPVQGRHHHGQVAAACRSKTARHIERLDLAESHAVDLLRTIPAELSISYIGFMLGRGNAVRVNLRGVRPGDLESLLAALYWPGDRRQAIDVFEMLVDATGQVAVALDFASTIQPTIGFEAALPDFPAREPRWRKLLDRLCADGLCTLEKRAALEGLGARLYPEQKGQDWPAAWIVAALRAAPRWVPWYERRLSHVKVSIAQDGTVGAKAYVSAQHHWSRESAAVPPSHEVSAAASMTALLERAADRASQFLLAEREQDDFWRDFRLVNGASDEWVTAFVGYVLVVSGLPLPNGLIAQTIRALLGRQRAEGGWGYNSISPADADSTAWVLKFLRAAEYCGPEVERGYAFLRCHFLLGGGVATYAPTTRISFGGMIGSQDVSGWRGEHLCVAANVAGLIGEPLEAPLLAGQAASGAWPAHWWRNDVFATALAVEALANVAAAGDARSRAMAWAAQCASTAQSAFDRAWLLQIFAKGTGVDHARALPIVRTLTADQRRDGGWDASAEMLYPNPAESSRRPDTAIVRDERRVFTAASALLALASARSAGFGQ